MNVHVNLKEASYNVIIERGVLQQAGKHLDLNRNVLIVTDTGVPEEYVECVASQCCKAGICRFPSGEQNKNFNTLQQILSAALHAGLTRGDCIVAVGGGVVTDLAGFAASCYMRGIDFYNIPTTLLAQVDASVGGKTGIDFEGVKNVVGAFWQPKKVLIDPDTLRTLPPRLLSEGLAESIKMAVTCDAELFERIESCSTDYCKTESCSTNYCCSMQNKADDKTSNIMENIEYIVERSVRIKASIVSQDEKETGLRRVLNFGHTIGHAIESLHNGKMEHIDFECAAAAENLQNGSMLHGECVAAGMIPMCSEAVRSRLVPVLQRFNLPTTITDKPEELLPLILHDKKRQKDKISVIISDKIGTYRISELTPEEIYMTYVKQNNLSSKYIE